MTTKSSSPGKFWILGLSLALVAALLLLLPTITYLIKTTDCSPGSLCRTLNEQVWTILSLCGGPLALVGLVLSYRAGLKRPAIPGALGLVLVLFWMQYGTAIEFWILGE